MRAASWLIPLLLCACAARAIEPASAPNSSRPPPPVRVPGPGAAGCVESSALKELVLALESDRRSSRAAALSALGVSERQSSSELAPALGVGQRYERDGKRFAVVAQLATVSAPLLALGVQGHSVRVLDERPRAHAVPLLVCGVNSCPPSAAPVLPLVRPLGVELASGEELGAPLRLEYDYWWAQVSYDRRRACPLEPAEGARPARAAGAAQ
jgi:hypothetical protein